MRETTDPFWKLLQAEHKTASAFCRKLCCDQSDGDDLYQDAVYRSLTRFGQLRDRSAFRSWFYKIVVNCYRNRAGNSWLKRFVPLTARYEAMPSEQDIARQTLARRRLEIALGALSARDRALLILHDLEGWSVVELSEMSCKSVDAVKARLSRARKKSKQALEKQLCKFPRTTGKTTVGGEDEKCVVVKHKNE